MPRPDETPDLAPGAIRQMQEIWLLLAKREWTSLVVLPAHASGSTKALACSLADIGTSLSDLPVSAVTVDALETGSARALASLAQDVRGRQKLLWPGEEVIEVAATPSTSPTRVEGDLLPSFGQLIIGVPSVVAEPVALAVAQAADAVVLGVELGTTKMRDLRRSIELIGRDRIAGCVLL